MTGFLLAALSTPSHAASLDLIEVGGAYGTPGTTDATATWWNPAGLAAGSGTRFHLEGAPLFAKVDIARTNPVYPYDPSGYGPETYDYSGQARYTRSTVVPFIGIASDLGQPGLGVGISLAVPHGRGAGGDPDQVTHHHLVKGGNQALYAQVSGAYEVAQRFAFGVTGAFVASEYTSDLYTETLTGLNDGLKDTFNRDQDYYSDTALESTRYTAHAQSSALKDSAITFGLGARLKASEKVALSVAYRHGFRVDNTGTATLTFDCPTVDDFWGRAGAELTGLCNAQLAARQTVGYDLPSRVHGSVLYTPINSVRLELMGGWVGWSVFQDYDITIQVDPASVVDAATPELAQQTAASVSQVKQWARDNNDSFWFALDGKVKADERVEIGGRILYDRAAVPTNALSPNNYDANTLGVTAVILGHVHENLSLGASAGQYFAGRRTVTDSVFGLAVAPADRKDPRYFYPAMNGTYLSTITRLGIIVRGQFQHGKKK
ncbi:MAG: hypothetical protein KC656_01165 [Myxococcales bacterium]|nr:hypothetical protein [Myxococcales bacterium]